jgi:putative transposase
MLEMGLEGRSGRIRSQRRTRPAHISACPNLLNRNFEATERNRVWVGDITQVRVRGEWHYICVVIDLFSRRVIGCNVSRSASAALATGAMKRAARGHTRLDGLVFHSDQGFQYVSERFREQLRILGVRQSMSRRGNCWDNAPAESFFATLKKELLSTTTWTSARVLHAELEKYIRYYNTERLHSTLGYYSPKDYEQQQLAA